MTADNKWRYVIGGLAVFGLFILALAFGLGRVEEATSFGLGAVLTGLVNVAIKFAEWCYEKGRPDSPVAPDAAQNIERAEK